MVAVKNYKEETIMVRGSKTMVIPLFTVGMKVVIHHSGSIGSSSSDFVAKVIKIERTKKMGPRVIVKPCFRLYQFGMDNEKSELPFMARTSSWKWGTFYEEGSESHSLSIVDEERWDEMFEAKKAIVQKWNEYAAKEEENKKLTEKSGLKTWTTQVGDRTVPNEHVKHVENIIWTVNDNAVKVVMDRDADNNVIVTITIGKTENGSYSSDTEEIPLKDERIIFQGVDNSAFRDTCTNAAMLPNSGLKKFPWMKSFQN